MKSVLITGGSGSFGRAFTRHLLNSDVHRVVIYSRGEHLQEEMASQFNDDRLRFFIGDVRDRKRLELAMSGMDTVVHAAALKIVPVAEYNPTECIATNIGGAENVVLASLSAGIKKVIALSTDKAVHPLNLYGASKLAAEKVFIAANNLAGGKCRFSIVRYGNVVGSRGSVLPLFTRLAAQGESLPVTDDRMTRFWIRMDQAIDLILHAHEHMDGREVFVPKIPSIRITDLAHALGADYHITGIRPGEKLHEILVTEDESRNAYDAGKYYIIVPNGNSYAFPEKDRIPDGFRYSSDVNDQWLNVKQLEATL